MQVLPTRQSEVARLLARGYVPIEISRELGVPYRTVKAELARLCKKYEIGGRRTKHVLLALALAPHGSASAGQVKALEILRPRQLRVTGYVAKGLLNQEIGDLMGISEGAIKNYLRDIFDKVGVWSRLELALWFVAHGGEEALSNLKEPSPLDVEIMNAKDRMEAIQAKIKRLEAIKQQSGISLEAGI